MADLEGVRVVVQFAFATLLPAAVSAALTVLIRRTKLGEASYWPWQIACGVIFGLIAIMGTEMVLPSDLWKRRWWVFDSGKGIFHWPLK